jgi:hypothetical protein
LAESQRVCFILRKRVTYLGDYANGRKNLYYAHISLIYGLPPLDPPLDPPEEPPLEPPPADPPLDPPPLEGELDGVLLGLEDGDELLGLGELLGCDLGAGLLGRELGAGLLGRELGAGLLGRELGAVPLGLELGVGLDGLELGVVPLGLELGVVLVGRLVGVEAFPGLVVPLGLELLFGRLALELEVLSLPTVTAPGLLFTGRLDALVFLSFLPSTLGFQGDELLDKVWRSVRSVLAVLFPVTGTASLPELLAPELLTKV